MASFFPHNEGNKEYFPNTDFSLFDDYQTKLYDLFKKDEEFCELEVVDKREIHKDFSKRKIESRDFNILFYHPSLKSCYKLVAFDKKTNICKFQKTPYPKKSRTITQIQMMDAIKELHPGLKIGTWFIKDNGYIGQIQKYKVQQKKDWDYTRDEKKNPKADEIFYDEIIIEYFTESQYDTFRLDINNPIWKENSYTKESVTIEEFKKKGFIIITFDDLKALDRETTRILENVEEIKMLNGGSDNNHNSSSSIVTFDSKEILLAKQQQMMIKSNEIQAISANIKRKMMLKREEVERELEIYMKQFGVMKKDLDRFVKKIEREIAKVYRLIATLEIFFGIKEEVIQISEGEAAPHDEPIQLRQQILYMDEEFGEYKDGGLEFKDITLFDKWLIDSGEFRKILPEPKGVVLMRSRRNEKDHGDPFLNHEYFKLDRLCYVLVRNGDNVYRICTDNIKYTDRLFPKRTELSEIFENLANKQTEILKQDNEYYIDKLNQEYDQMEMTFNHYQNNMMLVHGLIMRTEIFMPLPLGLNVMKPETHEGKLNFIYDEENLIQDGKPSYDEWLRENNKKLTKGSRIFITNDAPRKEGRNRFFLYFREYNEPKPPDSGIYQLKEYQYEKQVNVTETIPISEWDELEKQYKKDIEDIVIAAGYDKFNPNALYPISVSNKIDKSKKSRKYSKNQIIYDKEWDFETRDNRKPVSVVVNVLKNGEIQYKKIIETGYKITYNPKDTVYAGWGKEFDEGYSRERRTNLGYKIYPETDRFIINYDALLLDEIDYYLNDRVNRQHYLHMMPILRGLKREILAEKEKEKHIIDALNTRLKFENGIDFDIHMDISEAIEWYKNSLPTVWKRPMNPDNKDAWKLVELRTKSIIKKKYKLKDVKVVNNSAKEATAANVDGTYYLAENLSKADFTEKIWNRKAEYVWKAKGVTKKAIRNAIFTLDKNTYQDIIENQNHIDIIRPINKFD